MWDKAVAHVTNGGSIKDIEAKYVISEEYKVMIESAK
jgi:hypothetical protein